MKHTKKSGFSMLKFILSVIVLISAAILAFKVVPPYINNGKVEHIFNGIAADPDMQTARDSVIRDVYAKRAAFEGLSVFEADQLAIDHANGKLSLSAAYTVKLKLIANINLLIEFQPTSSN